MAARVALILLGLLIFWVLRDYVGLPRSVAGIVAFIPFALGEAKGLGPYEKSGSDVLHGTDEPGDGA